MKANKLLLAVLAVPFMIGCTNQNNKSNQNVESESGEEVDLDTPLSGFIGRDYFYFNNYLERTDITFCYGSFTILNEGSYMFDRENAVFEIKNINQVDFNMNIVIGWDQLDKNGVTNYWVYQDVAPSELQAKIDEMNEIQIKNAKRAYISVSSGEVLWDETKSRGLNMGITRILGQ